ncbi:MAG: phage portal protein [Planctomycetaceae bacterium]|jgi:capsid protein|nr:phage portal protein [Planctomycetaceae bacterium]
MLVNKLFNAVRFSGFAKKLFGYDISKEPLSRQLRRFFRIRTPNDIETDIEWVHGVKTDIAGADVGYAVHSRKQWGGFEFERYVPAENMILHGYFTRFDQVRGIGLLVSAANMFKDVYDSFDYALAKAKMMQLFGLKFKRDGMEPLGKTQKQEEEAKRNQRKIDLQNKASYIVELQEGEDIESIESGQPSVQFQDYTKLMIMTALKSLDICYSMFDENHTNFYGSRAGITQYVESCKPKRESNIRLLEELTYWKLANEIIHGRLVLPGSMTVNDLWFDWTPCGLPWWRPDEEAKGLLTTITAGFDSYGGVCRSLGKEFRDIIDERQRDEEYARQHNVILPTMTEKINLNIGT